MRDHSSMTLLEFLFSVGFKFTIGTVWYKNILFRLLPHHSITQSFHVLLALAVVSILFFTVVLRHWKNGWTSTACFVLPFGVYTIMTYSATFLLPIQALAVAAGAVSVVYAAALFAQKVKFTEKRARKKVYKNRFSRCVYTVFCIIAAAMLTLMVGIGWNKYFGTAILSSSVETAGFDVESKVEDTLASNMDTVLKLQPSVWDELSTKQRLNVLQTVANIESHYLGLHDGVTVQADILPEHTLGIYSDKYRLVRINLTHLESDPVEEVLDTLLHEVHHSYTNRLADVYDAVPSEYQDLRLLRDASHYSDESSNYVDPREDYYGYISQHVEMDSETYAAYGVQEYYARISEWLTQNEQTDSSNDSSSAESAAE